MLSLAVNSDSSISPCATKTGTFTWTQRQAYNVHAAFLRLPGPTTQFAKQGLCLLTEEQHAIYRASRSPVAFIVGSPVMARVQVLHSELKSL